MPEVIEVEDVAEVADVDGVEDVDGVADVQDAEPPAQRPGRLRRVASDAGMTTAEYAVGTVAACGFAGVLYQLLTSGTVVSLLTGIVKRALSTGV